MKHTRNTALALYATLMATSCSTTRQSHTATDTAMLVDSSFYAMMHRWNNASVVDSTNMRIIEIALTPDSNSPPKLKITHANRIIHAQTTSTDSTKNLKISHKSTTEQSHHQTEHNTKPTSDSLSTHFLFLIVIIPLLVFILKKFREVL